MAMVYLIWLFIAVIKLIPHYAVLVGSRNGLKHLFNKTEKKPSTIKLLKLNST